MKMCIAGHKSSNKQIPQLFPVVKDVKAKIAIPIHYGLYEGKPEDAKTFKDILKGKIEVILLKEE